jgi:hypothetical protein
LRLLWNRSPTLITHAPCWQPLSVSDKKNGFLNEKDFDQVIRENPASRGTEASAKVLVGPPWRMESNAGQQQRY